jgi:hypothetical protein
MNSDDLLLKQAEMLLDADPGVPGYAPRVWVYRALLLPAAHKLPCLWHRAQPEYKSNLGWWSPHVWQAIRSRRLTGIQACVKNLMTLNIQAGLSSSEASTIRRIQVDGGEQRTIP